jgi:hypothetical protein
MDIANPYASTTGYWFKGNTHLHPVESGESLQDALNHYWYDGYDFLAVSDHNVVTDVSPFLPPGKLAIPAEECSRHVVGVGLKEAVPRQEGDTHQDNIDRINAQGGLAIVAHPEWSGLTRQELADLQGMIGIEVFNGLCSISGRGVATNHWDHLMTAHRRSYWGFAVDDAHRILRCLGMGWIMVRARELTREAIMGAIEEGNFYATQGPRFESIHLEDSTLTVHTSSVVLVQFRDRNFRVLSAEEGAHVKQARYTITGEELYVRVEIRDGSGRHGWTNPLWVGGGEK